MAYLDTKKSSIEDKIMQAAADENSGSAARRIEALCLVALYTGGKYQRGAMRTSGVHFVIRYELGFHGVSQSRVRSALKRLEEHGVVENRSYSYNKANWIYLPRVERERRAAKTAARKQAERAVATTIALLAKLGIEAKSDRAETSLVLSAENAAKLAVFVQTHGEFEVAS